VVRDDRRGRSVQSLFHARENSVTVAAGRRLFSQESRLLGAGLEEVETWIFSMSLRGISEGENGVKAN
jgi:hypothetical protein